MAKKLLETATLTKTGSKVRVRLINEGQGASGFYSAELLETDGPKAFPKGAFLFWNHVPDDKRDMRDAFGVLAEDAVFEGDSKALWGDAEIFEADRTRVMELAEAGAGMSIQASGDIDEDGNVTHIEENPFNSVALVHRAGRGGAITDILESANINDSNENQREDAGMTPEEIEKLAVALAEKLSAPLGQAIAEALKPAPKEENEEIDPLKVAEALVDVPKAAHKRIVEAIRAGEEIEKAVEAEKAYIKDLTEAAKNSEGRVVESEKIEPQEAVSVRGW